MLLSDIVDKLHYKNGLTYACSSEQTDLTALGIRTEKVYDLNSCLKERLAKGGAGL